MTDPRPLAEIIAELREFASQEGKHQWCENSPDFAYRYFHALRDALPRFLAALEAGEIIVNRIAGSRLANDYCDELAKWEEATQ